MGLDPGVKLLQEELSNLATASGNMDCAPGRSDGTMSLGTIVALSHAAGILGNSVDPTLGKAVDVVNLIKKPLAKIPYAGQVVDLVLSPWIIDSVFDTIIAIIKIIPGAGDAAEAIRQGVNAFELILATAASSIAGALALARKSGAVKPQALGDATRAWWTTRERGPEFYNPTIHGPLLACPGLLGDAPPANTGIQYTAASLTPKGLIATPVASTGQAQTQTSSRPIIQVGMVGGGTKPPCPTNQYRTAAGVCAPIPSCPSGQTFNASLGICQVMTVHTHFQPQWPAGQPIRGADWSSTKQFKGKATLNDLAPDDAHAFTAMVAKASTLGGVSQAVRDRVTRGVQTGLVAFKKFKGADGNEMGAFYNIGNSTLTIVPLPKALQTPHRSSSAWGSFVNAVDGAVNTVGNAIEDAANATGNALESAAYATGDFLSDLWDSIDEQVIWVYETVKKYGCALVGSDIVVALAATGAGIVATPATSAAIVAGAAAGRAGCAALEVGELIIKILQLLSQDFPKPPPLAPTGTNPAEWTVANTIKYRTTPPSGQLILGAPFTYPTGSITRFNTDTRMWVIYAPITAFSGTDGPGGKVIPPVPEGFVRVGDIIDRPPGVPTAGTERNATALSSPWVWAGAGVAVIGTGLIIRYRRHTR